MNTGGPAFPQHGWSNDQKVLERMKNQGGMTLLDWYAGQETLSDWDHQDAIIPPKLSQHFGGEMPLGGWVENPVAAFERDAEIRARMKYSRASAMLAEKARREEAAAQSSAAGDHSRDAETTLRLLAADVLPADIKDAANDRLPSWCAEQVRARVNTLESINRELVEALESIELSLTPGMKHFPSIEAALGVAQLALAKAKGTQ